MHKSSKKNAHNINCRCNTKGKISHNFYFCEAPNQTSTYTGVFWDKKDKKWQAKIMHKGKCYFGGYSDIEEHAAMKINLLCDKIEIERKNLMINIDLDAIQKVIQYPLYMSF